MSIVYLIGKKIIFKHIKYKIIVYYILIGFSVRARVMLQDKIIKIIIFLKKNAIKHALKLIEKGVMYVQSLQDVIRTKQKDFNYNYIRE